MKKPSRFLSAALSLCILFGFAELNAVMPYAAAAPKEGARYYYVTGEPSAYGHTDGWWEDENGNRVDIGEVSSGTRAAVKNRAGTPLPSSYDSREDNLISPVKSQIGGTCWAHAAVGALEASAVKQGIAAADSINLSEYHLAWYTYNGYYPNVSGDSRNDGSSNPDAIFYGGSSDFVLKTWSSLNGAANASRYSDTLTAGNETGLMPQMSRAFTYGSKFDCDILMKKQYPVDVNNKSAIKQAIMDNGGICFPYNAVDECYNPKTGAFYSPIAQARDGHEVLAVGWDDNYSKSNFLESARPAGDGAWLCKNSWGSSWGNGGYFWMSYEDATLEDPVVYVAADRGDYGNVYSYSGAANGSVFYVSLCGSVYTAKKDEYVSAVGIRAAWGDTNYKIDIYKNLSSDYDEPTDGTLAFTQSGTASSQSYSVVDLTRQIPVAEGERFAVVIESDGPVFLEGKSSYGQTYSSAHGESYYSLGGSWFDSHDEGDNNVCMTVFMSDCAHVFRDTVVKNTCTAGGYTEHACTLCDYSFTDNPTKATGHLYGAWVYDGEGNTHTKACQNPGCEDTVKQSCLFSVITVPPTCTEKGYDSHVCSACGNSYDDPPAYNATGHSEVTDEEIPATCTAPGKTQGSHCSVCSKVITAQAETPPLDHAWAEGYTVDVNPTCTEAGSQSIHCSRCSETKGSCAVKELGHDYGSPAFNGAQAKSHSSVCSRNPAHKVTESCSFISEVKAAATCINPGSRVFTCSVCSGSYSEAIPATGHTDKNGDNRCDACNSVINPVGSMTLAIKNSAPATINYGYTRILSAQIDNIPDGYRLEWSADSGAVAINPVDNGLRCEVKSVGSGSATVTVRLIGKDGKTAKNLSGNELQARQSISSNAGFIQRIAFFFKNLFGLVKPAPQIFKAN